MNKFAKYWNKMKNNLILKLNMNVFPKNGDFLKNKITLIEYIMHVF